jgi:hypothetical protein
MATMCDGRGGEGNGTGMVPLTSTSSDTLRHPYHIILFLPLRIFVIKIFYLGHSFMNTMQDNIDKIESHQDLVGSLAYRFGMRQILGAFTSTVFLPSPCD